MQLQTSQQRNLPLTGYIRQSNILHLIPISASTLWRMVRSKKFPQPFKLSERVTAWRAEDVRAWINAQGKE